MPALGRHLESIEREGWRHGAGHQRPGPERARRLPAETRHDHLRSFALCEIGAEAMHIDMPAIMREAEIQGCARMPVPDLIGIDAMPMADLAFAQQIIDRGAGGAFAQGRILPPGLAIMAAFGMRRQVEQTDDVLGLERHRKASLRLRISANTSALLAMDMPSSERISLLSGRRKTLVASSSPIVPGNVISRLAR